MSKIDTYITSPWQEHYRLVPDEQTQIAQEPEKLSDEENCCLIFTTGGTGPAKRDVTPEATTPVCEKMLPGFGELMRQESLKYVPTAILSRQTAGIRKETVIINLPGKPSAIRECMQAIFPAVPYCVELVSKVVIEGNDEYVKVFRPK